MPYPFNQPSSSWLYGWYSLSSLCTSILQKMEFCLSSTYTRGLILWTLSIIILRVNPIFFLRPPPSPTMQGQELQICIAEFWKYSYSELHFPSKIVHFFQDHIVSLFTSASISHEALQRSRISFSFYLCCRWYYVQNVVNLFVIKKMSIILNANAYLFNAQSSTLIIFYVYFELENYRLFFSL